MKDYIILVHPHILHYSHIIKPTQCLTSLDWQSNWSFEWGTQLSRFGALSPELAITYILWYVKNCTL